jgi:hypothetical protein
MLRRLVVIDRKLRRCWLLGQRAHHGAVGVCLVALGTALAVHDRTDARDWFRWDRWT